MLINIKKNNIFKNVFKMYQFWFFNQNYKQVNLFLFLNYVIAFSTSFLSIKSIFIFLKINNTSVLRILLTFRFGKEAVSQIMLGLSIKSKMYWTVFSYSPIRFFYKVKVFSWKYEVFSSENLFQKLSNYVIEKKKSGFLKKKQKQHLYVLLRLFQIKSNKFPKKLNKNTININRSFNSTNLRKLTELNSRDVKSFDLKKQWYVLFKDNRVNLKNFMFYKKRRQFQFTKFFSKNIKLKYKNTRLSFEFSLINLIIRSKLLLSTKDVLFIIKKNMVYINGSLISDVFYTVKVSDVVTIKLSKKYYFFYKNNFNDKLKSTFSLGQKIWRLYRFKNNFYKQSPSNLSYKILHLTYFYEDVPLFLEVDYCILSFTLIKVPTKYYEYNYIFNKFINLFLMRLYNWKHVV